MFRRRTADKGWTDSLPGREDIGPAQRYMHIPEIDRWRSLGQDMPPAPERGAVMQRVRQLVEGLDGALDEGTGAALDRLIEAWVAAWLAGVDLAYVDGCSVIDVHYGQASQWLVETETLLEHETAKLARLSGTRDAAHARLAGTTREA